MIKKKREEYQEHVGEGRPFEVRPERLALKNDKERNNPQIIQLSDLEQEGKSPINFHTKRGRVLASFRRYWTPDEMRSAQDEGFDIE